MSRGPKNIEISEPAGNFLFRNMFNHDAIHDFNAAGGAKRMMKLNHLFERLTGKQLSDYRIDEIEQEVELTEEGDEDESSGGNRIIGGEPFSRRIIDIDPDSSNDIIENYENFDPLDSYHILTTSSDKYIEKKLKTLHETLHETPLYTRSQATTHRKLVALIQSCNDYIGHSRLTILGNPPMELHKGGKDIQSINKQSHELLLYKLQSVKLPSDKKSHEKSKIPEEIDQIFKSFFNSYNDVQTQKSVFEKVEKYDDINSKVLYFFEVFKSALLYYHNSIDATLPLYSIINSYFIEDTLLLCMIDLLVSPTLVSDDFSKYFEPVKKVRISDSTLKTDGGGEKKEKQINGGTITDIRKYIVDTLPEETFLIGDDSFLTENDITLSLLKDIDIDFIYDILNTKLLTMKVQLTDIEKGRDSDHESIFLKLTNETVEPYGLLQRLWKKEAILLNRELNSMKENFLRNIRKARRSHTVFNIKCISIFESLLTTLKKEYNNLHSSSPFTYKESTGSKSTSLSASGTTFIQNFLQSLTKGILNVTSGTDTPTPSDRFKLLYDKEKELLTTVEKSGHPSSTFDKNLLETFFSCVSPENKKVFLRSEVKDKLTEAFTVTPRHIINNALTTPLSDNPSKRIVTDLTDNGYIMLCPPASVLDAQGAFGSCNNGKDSTNFSKGNQDITIHTPRKADGSSIFEFNININVSTNGKFTVTYYSIYDTFTVSDCVISGIIGTGALNILSANNTFKDLINHAELRFHKNGRIDWSIFDNINDLQHMVRIVSRKLIGDLSQELTAITTASGYTSLPLMNIDPNPYSETAVSKILTNGDQPSTVRAAFLLLMGQGDIADNVGVVYVTKTDKGFLIKKDVSLSAAATGKARKGGKKNSKTNRKISKKYKKSQRRTRKKNRFYL